MNVVSLMFAGLLVVAGACSHDARAQAQPAQSPAQPAGAPEPATVDDGGQAAVRSKVADDPNERICKYVVQTGSRMGNKQCRTRAYWAEMELAARNKMREIDSQAIPVKAN